MLAEFGALIDRFVEPESHKLIAFIGLGGECYECSLIFDAEAFPDICWHSSVSSSFNFNDLCVDAGNNGRSIENRVDLVGLVDSKDSTFGCPVNSVVNVFRHELLKSGGRFCGVYFENILDVHHVQSILVPN